MKIGTTQAQRKLFFSLARTRHEIERLTPGAGLDQEGIDVNLVAKKLRVRPSDVVEMQQRMEGRDLSLDASVADGTSTHLEFTPGEGDPQDEELARAEEEALVHRRVSEAMGRLDPRERHIVEARIMGDGKETLRDLGQHFGFSRERARQLEIRALEKLRRELQPLAEEIGWPGARGPRRVTAAPRRSEPEPRPSRFATGCWPCALAPHPLSARCRCRRRIRRRQGFRIPIRSRSRRRRPEPQPHRPPAARSEARTAGSPLPCSTGSWRA